MGAGSYQFAASDWDESGNPSTRPRFEDIPENCIALVILTRLDLIEIWKLARLNQSSCGTSLADFIWETKLPLNYGYIVDELGDEKVGDLGKKEIAVEIGPF
ncbi:hypothetical protein Vadar_009247 [Vaccinium darrowii]|uniref:Uncharacterized protein n=1 Tax=Vaccinium darrowii TaxID=229202 RepID=A0ACB7Y7A5_9ERIC|nr:hypothetical protein Vadar_009247 [Vaccinium darrowii]